MTPREIAAEALLRVERRASRAISRAGDTIDSAYISDKDLARSLKGEPLAAVAGRIRERNKPRLTAGLSDLAGTSETIKQFFPDAVDLAVREADSILAHRINVFDVTYDLGPQIDWRTDIGRASCR